MNDEDIFIYIIKHGPEYTKDFTMLEKMDVYFNILTKI